MENQILDKMYRHSYKDQKAVSGKVKKRNEMLIQQVELASEKPMSRVG